jgi:hypothetical protein
VVEPCIQTPVKHTHTHTHTQDSDNKNSSFEENILLLLKNYFETGSRYVTQASIELAVILLLVNAFFF